VRKALERLPRTRLINGYGPTDGTTFTCCYAVSSTPAGPSASIPIGRPIANTRVYILDSCLQPVPAGVYGELCIAGDGVARGYLNRPELTAERFDRSYKSYKTHALYRTGDLARWLPGGDIEFLGRMDRQVKVRGFRIEPGEIEATLKTHPEIRDAVVLAREDIPGDRRLTAYYTITAGNKEPDPTLLKEFLKQKLPHFMIPASFIKLDRFPLSPNGKIDYAAFPAPGQGMPGDTETYIPPGDAVEIELVKIWETLLHVKPVGITDDFFRLGGYSLLATRLFHRLEKRTGKKLPAAAIFHAPTIEKLARILRGEKASNPWSSLVPIRVVGSRPPIFFMHQWDGGVLDYRGLAAALGDDQPVYGIQTLLQEGTPLDYIDIRKAAEYYVEVIKTVAGRGPYYVGGHSFGGIVAVETARVLAGRGEEVALLAVIDARAPGTHLLSRREINRFLLRTYLEKVRFHSWRLFNLKGKKRWRYLVLKWDDVRKNLKKSRKEFNRLKNLGTTDHSRKSPYAKVTRLLERSGLMEEGYSGKVTLFRASIPFPIVEREDYGWGKYARGGVKVYIVKGEHGNLLKEPYALELAKKINECIET